MKVPTKPTSEKESVEDQAAKIAKKEATTNHHEQEKQQETEINNLNKGRGGAGSVTTMNGGGAPAPAGVKAKENIRPDKNGKKSTASAAAVTGKQHHTTTTAAGVHPIVGPPPPPPPHPAHPAQHGLYHPYHAHPHLHHPHYATHMAPPPHHVGPPPPVMIQQAHLYRRTTQQQQHAMHPPPPPPGVAQQTQSHRTHGNKLVVQANLEQHAKGKEGGGNKTKNGARSTLKKSDDGHNTTSAANNDSAKGGIPKWSKEEVRSIIFEQLMLFKTYSPTVIIRLTMYRSWHQDDALRKAVDELGTHDWKRIAKYLPTNRSDHQCQHRWLKVLKSTLVKGPWTAEEDATVERLVGEYGAKKWSLIASHLPGRVGKQCRERWHNHLNPDICKEAWTTQEDRTILEYHSSKGNRWAEIAKLLPGR